MRLRTGSDTLELKEAASVLAWFRAIRFHYVPPSFLPAMLGAVVAWSLHRGPDIPGFLLVVIGVTINHFGLNMLDDVCDYLHNVDQGTDGDRNPYTGGSGVLTEGLLSPRQLVIASIGCFVTTSVIGVYLAFIHGWPVLVLGVFGIFCSVFYTLPPIRFGYRGLGELGLLVNFGPVIGLGSYYVQAHSFAMEPFLTSLVLGVLMWSEIVINEIPDYDEDLRGGKLNLVVRVGRRRAVILYVMGLAAAYGLLLLTVIYGFAPPALLAGFVSLPYAVHSVIVLKEYHMDKVRMIPANLAMIKTHLFTGLGMIGGYLIHLWHYGS